MDGTSFALSLHSDKPGMWTLDSVVGNPADGIAITRSWLVREPDPKNPVFGFGFPVPPTKDNPAQVELWKVRQPIPGAKLEGDPAQFVALLRLNRTTANKGVLTGLVITYTDTVGSHTQSAAGFTVILKPPGSPC